MVVAIQQPEHLPWIGFFNKMAQSDMFVYLDNVQFKKRYFENRNRLKTRHGILYFTLPVYSKGRYHQKINQVPIYNELNWKKKYKGRLELSLRKAPYWEDVKDIVFSAIENNYHKLVDLNITLIENCRKYLNINTKTVLASKFNTGQRSGSDLLLSICRVLRANSYLSGPDGRKYLDHKEFEKYGIDIVFHDFKHPTYPQRFNDFVSHLSVLDIIANCGPESSKIIIECYKTN